MQLPVKEYVAYAPEYREHVIEAARNAGPMSLRAFISSLPADEHERRPSTTVTANWLKIAGVSLKRRVAEITWTDEMRERAVSFVLDDGMTPAQARRAMMKVYGLSPAASLIRSWLPRKEREAAPDETEGDSWQVAQDAADRYSRYSQAVQDFMLMCSWIPDMKASADEAAYMQRQLKKHDWTKTPAPVDEDEFEAGDVDEVEEYEGRRAA